jgi:hypothetical protein
MVLLGVCVLALGIGLLRLVTERTPLPVGSSYSTEAAGAQALYEWLGVTGASPARLQEAVVPDDAPPSTLLVLQPESTIDPSAQQAYDTVARNGGTLVVAGDSFAWVLYTRELGVAVSPAQTQTDALSAPDDGTLPGVRARYRLKAPEATPLLLDANGEVAALRKPYLNGTLVVIATPQPLLNQWLRDDTTARFAFRQVVKSASTPTAGVASTATAAFDEAHHSFAPPQVAGAPVTTDQLLFNTPGGRALLYAVLLAFIFALLTGRRLGPAVLSRGPTETRRTMYEHVQMIANLYRRSHQLDVARATLARQYQRQLVRAGVVPSSAAHSAERIATARTESELLDAVTAAEARARA